MRVLQTFVTIARSMGEDPGRIEVGHYTVDDGMVTLTNDAGEPLASGRIKPGYASKLHQEEPADVARRLLWRWYRASRGNGDFSRPIQYRSEGWR